MDLVRENKRAFTAIAAGLAVIVLVLLMTFLHRHATANSGTMIGKPVSVGSQPAVEPVVGRSSPRTPKHSAPVGRRAAIAGSALPGVAPGLLGTGGAHGLTPHRVVIAAGSDGPLLGVGWEIPTADGTRSGKDLSYQSSFRHVATAYGRPAYAELYTRVGPNSSMVWCTVTVDGRVTERRVGHGPWADVFCLG